MDKSENNYKINLKNLMTEDASQSYALKKDHQNRPLWVLNDKKIFLETYSPLYRQAYEFLIAIAEPRSRPLLIQEYEITQSSLYAAMILQLTPQTIKKILLKLAKNQYLPKDVQEFIDINTAKFGAAKLFLEGNKYQIEIFDESLLEQTFRGHKIIRNLKTKINDMKDIDDSIKENTNTQHWIENIENSIKLEKLDDIKEQIEKIVGDDIQEENEMMELEQSNVIQLKSTSIQKKKSKIYEIIGSQFDITQAFLEKNIPLIEEYDYTNDNSYNRLKIELKSSTKIRHHQEKSLSKIFIGGKARSGLIVLPCGAGKTLLGISATNIIKKRTLIFCQDTQGINQWRNQFKQFCDISDDYIVSFSSKGFDYEKFQKVQNESFIILTTYKMISQNRDPKPQNGQVETINAKNKRQTIEKMQQLDWGIIILDEVHQFPAKTFQTVLEKMKAHFKLGLTATLLREDDKIENLYYTIGPKLYEENWLDLINAQVLARPYCVEIRCKMTPEFKKAYKDERGREAKLLLHVGNPNKFLALQYLVNIHEARGDKIIVFSDKPYILMNYAQQLKCAVIHGGVSPEERETVFDTFKNSTKINTIFLSSVGDSAIDLPNANVVIQLSSYFSSRRQEAQRLGRIMRPKPNNEFGQYNAFFYNLVSQDTDETLYASKRQKFLVDQGFSYEIVTELPYEKDIEQKKQLKMFDESSQREHLDKILKKCKKDTNKNQNKKQKQQLQESDNDSEVNIYGSSSDSTDYEDDNIN